MSTSHIATTCALATLCLLCSACTAEQMAAWEAERDAEIAHYSNPEFEYVWEHADGTTYDIPPRTPTIATGQTIRLVIRDELDSVVAPSRVEVSGVEEVEGSAEAGEEVLRTQLDSRGRIDIEALAPGRANLLVFQGADDEEPSKSILISVEDAASVQIAPDEISYVALASANELAYMTDSTIELDVAYVDDNGSPLLGEEFSWRGQEPRRAEWRNRYEIRLPSSPQEWSLDLLDEEVEAQPLTVVDAESFDELAIPEGRDEQGAFKSKELAFMLLDDVMALGVLVNSETHTLQDYGAWKLEVTSVHPEVCEARMARGRYEPVTRPTVLAQLWYFFPDKLTTYLRIEALAPGECEVVVSAPSLPSITEPLVIRTAVVTEPPAQMHEEGEEEVVEEPEPGE